MRSAPFHEERGENLEGLFLRDRKSDFFKDRGRFRPFEVFDESLRRGFVLRALQYRGGVDYRLMRAFGGSGDYVHLVRRCGVCAVDYAAADGSRFGLREDFFNVARE